MRMTIIVILALFCSGYAVMSPQLEQHLLTTQENQLLPVNVVLKNQFDAGVLNSLVDGMPRSQRRMEVARILQEFSAREQASLLGYLDGRAGVLEVRSVMSLWIVNAVYCEATPAVIREIAERADVNYVNYDLAWTPELEKAEPNSDERDEIAWGVSKVNAPAVWALGYTGQGVVCGLIDTGCNYNHPDLNDHMWTDPNYPFYGWNFESNNNNPMDVQGHGTHCGGSIASDGTAGSQCGVAPDAQLMVCRVRTQADSIAESQCWAAMQFCVSPPLSPANGADLYSMSLGWYISWNPQQAIWRQTADAVNAAGLSQFVAAGNERGMNTPPNACRCPGNAPPPWWNPQNTGSGSLSGIVSVGATTSTDAIASFSSPGPTTWASVAPYNDYAYPPGLTRPDISAPGEDIKSCALGGGYTTMSGTSMATPHSAGVACLLLSKNPNLTPREIDSILEVTAVDRGPTGKDNDFGAGRIDALAAVNAVRPPFGVRYASHVVDDSVGGNNDGIVNPGEAINLPVRIVNLCDYTARGIRGKLRTSDANITITDSVKHLGSVLQDSFGYTGPDGYNFSVAAGCTNRYELKFDLAITDTLDSLWVSGISILVGTPRLAADSVYAYDGANGKVDPGEECDIAIRLRNRGLGNAYTVSAVLVSGDVRFTVLDSMAVYGFVPADSWLMNLADHFRVSASASIPRELVIPCTLRVTQTGYPAQNIAFGIEIGRLTSIDPIPDGPRSPALYWAYDNADSLYQEAPVFGWVEIRGVGTPLTLSDDQTVVVNLPTSFGPFRFYNQNYTQVSICGNGWIAPGSTTTSTYTNTALPSSAMPPVLALNWDDLYPPTGGGVRYHHDEANHRFIVEWDSVPYYGNRSTFEKQQIILYDTTLASWDGNCEFVFQYLTANQTNSATVGQQDPTKTIAIQALFNDVYHRASSPIVAGRAIKFTTDTVLTAIAEGRGAVNPRRLSLAPSANPFVSSVMLSYSLPQPTSVRLSVFDATGRSVRDLVNSGAGEQAAGSYTVAWDGTDAHGRKLSAGIYFYQLETSVGRLSRKAVIAR